MPHLELEHDLIRKLERLSIAARRLLSGLLRGERRSKRRGASVEFADFRDYCLGDDPRYIDWNAYGRLDSLFLKLFVEEEELLVWILLDCSASMGFGEPGKLEYAAKVAAALAHIALSSHDRASICLLGGSGETLPMQRGRGAIFKVIEFLSRAEAGGEADLEAAVRKIVSRSRRRGVVFLISDLFLQEGFLRPLEMLAWSGFDPVVLHVLSREDVEPELSGDIMLVDSETDDAVAVSPDARTLRAYDRRLESFLEAARTGCRKWRMPYMRATTDVPFDEFVLRWLRRASVLRQ